jgi:Sulfotransferase domain
MKVIGAGLPRTGTMSLKLALEQLGCGPCYHYSTLWQRPGDVDTWAAIEAGQPADWDALLGDFQSAVDWPPSMYYKELMQQYPEAKVVLTLRDPDHWYESFSNTILWAHDMPAEPGQEKGRDLMLAYAARTFEGSAHDRQGALATFQRYGDEVQEYVPREQLLVFEVQEGWEPLCRFLDVPVPEGRPFPRANDRETFRQRVVNMRSTK